MTKSPQGTIQNNLSAGHRTRLRKRFLESSIRSLPDYEILEMLLFKVFSQKDTKRISKLLLERFGSLAAIVSADSADLKSIPSVGDSTIEFLRLLQDFFSRLMLPTNKGKLHVFDSWLAVLHYCQFTIGFKKKEYFRVLFLNKKNILIADEIFHTGTVDKVAIYPREIAKQALFHGASAIIMVHNHPSGEVAPSKEDIEITDKVNDALTAVNITLHDHLIVAKNEHFSFRNHDLL